MKKLTLSLLPFAFCLLPFAFSAQAQAPRTMNAAEIKLALNKLGKLCSILYVGAHPDDENTAVLAYAANEMQCRTAYLSLTRGEGGQNLIGSEKGAALGVIRTQELLAARRIDGAEQFFTRAIDFGFSKTAEETLRLWNKQEVLSDVVWVIRKFRPDVIINRFPPDNRAGHGHHQSSAILSAEAFKLAGDEKAFPEQLKYVSIWQPKRMVWNSFIRQGDTPPADAIKYDVGKFNPLLGKTYTEIAAESRTMHKSQGQGTAPARGARIEYFTHVDGEKATKELLDGVETSWKRIEGGENVQNLIVSANSEFDLKNPVGILDNLLEIKRNLPNPEIAQLKNQQGAITNIIFNESLRKKYSDIDDLTLAVSGFSFEAFAKESLATPDSEVKVAVNGINRLRMLVKQQIVYMPVPKPKGVQVPSSQIFALHLEPYQSSTQEATVYFSPSTSISQPFWLYTFNPNQMYKVAGYLNINGNTPDIPENTASYYFRFQTTFEKGSVLTAAPLLYRYLDKVRGEVYQPFVIAPPVVLNLAEPLQVFPTTKAKQVRLTIRNNANALYGVVKLNLPEGWQAEPKEIPVSFTEKGAEQIVSFTITPTATAKDGNLQAFVEANGQRYDKQQITIDYPHIPQQTLFPNAEAKLVRLDIKTGKERIGYIMGSGDEIPDALQQLGYNVKLLSDEDLQTLDLSANFDTIIAGIRAFNTRAVLKKQNARLLDFVKNGGKLVVQYNVTDNTLFQNFAPFPLKLSNDRVTVEDAPVKFLQPDSPILNFPNKITDADFAGWVQERGIYFASEFDANNFTPILEMHDPNEPEKKGSLLIANYGKGKFIYTGLAFFRQLPAGVPGAYRLFVNLISKQKN